MKKIVLFDPSIGDNKGSLSPNLGDVIINESVLEFLKDSFRDLEIVKISTHVALSKTEKSLLKDTEYVFVGGTNLLSADIKTYNQWKSNYYKSFFLLPSVNNAILFGVGWWQYQDKPTRYTSSFYKRLLSSHYKHSVRDYYTKNKIEQMGIMNSVNTSCPTTWNLNGFLVDRMEKDVENVLLMLTDYHADPKIDNKILELLLEKFSDKVYFFPQGSLDEAYLKTLKSYKENKDKFVLLGHDVGDLNQLIESNSNLVYVGTRLHGGIRCLQNKMPALILSNDNRSLELGKDINLAVVRRDDITGIQNWIEGKTNFGKIRLPDENIVSWKQQFRIGKEIKGSL